MRGLLSAFVFACLIVTISYGVQPVFAKQAVSASADGQCRLYNEKSNNYKYEGNCTIKQNTSSGANEYDIKLGSGESYRFIQQGSTYKVQTPEGLSDHMATMTDSGNVATFEWYKWKLTAEVTESSEPAPASNTKASASGSAQGTVQGLSDLVGAKAGQAESTVEQRGYKYVKTDKSGEMSFSYWRESGSNKCVSIKTEDGRYQAIVYTPDFNCGNAAAAETKASSTERAGQGQFDATGNIPCAQSKGQPMGQCPFGVAREGIGTAAVSVTMPDGRKRMIFFENGKPTSADLSQADGNMNFSYTKESDLYMIRAGNERYEIPEVVVYGD
ncbi:MAG TPA: hypothetical protein VFJ67_01910 [Thermodesulfobacteriota bacterium]|nr:hypothetical protein [Thermodesulfobacteriota bacterium]